MDQTISLGDWIKRRRKALDLTQEALAQGIGCAITSRKIEADERRPSRQTAERLAGCFQLSSHDRVTFLRTARAEICIDQVPLPSTTLTMPSPHAIIPRCYQQSSDTELPAPPLLPERPNYLTRNQRSLAELLTHVNRVIPHRSEVQR